LTDEELKKPFPKARRTLAGKGIIKSHSGCCKGERGAELNGQKTGPLFGEEVAVEKPAD